MPSDRTKSTKLTEVQQSQQCWKRNIIDKANGSKLGLFSFRQYDLIKLTELTEAKKSSFTKCKLLTKLYGPMLSIPEKAEKLYFQGSFLSEFGLGSIKFQNF